MRERSRYAFLVGLLAVGAMAASHAALLDAEPSRIHRPASGYNSSTDGFASTLVRVGDTVLIGAPQDRFEPGDASGSVYAYRKSAADWELTGVLSPGGFGACDFSRVLAGNSQHAFAAARVGACNQSDGSLLFRVDIDAAGIPTIGAAAILESEGRATIPGEIDADDATVVVTTYFTGGDLGDAVLAYGVDLLHPPQRLEPSSDAIYFSGQVAVSGKWLAVSCLGVDVQDGIQPGCVQLFQRVDASHPWSAAGVLDAPSGVDSATFGAELRIAGERLFVGAPAQRGGPPYVSGTVAEYALIAGQWQHRSTLAPTNGLPRDEFGKRITFDAGELYVFAPARRESPDRRDGGLYRYCEGPDAWQPCGFLEAPAGDEDWPRPEDVAVFDDEILLAQSYFYNLEDGSQGSVGRVERNATLTPIGTFHPGDGGSAGDSFGYSVATGGNLLVIGAPGYHGQGAVFIYRRSGTAWVLDYIASGDSIGPNCPPFGSAVAVGDGGVAATNGCAAEADDAHGYIVFFTRDENGWSQARRHAVPRTPDNAGFGNTLLLSDGRVVYGAPGATSDGVYNAGAVHVLRPFANGFLDTVLHPPVPRENGRFGTQIAVRRAQRPQHADADMQVAVAGSDMVLAGVELFSIRLSGLDAAIHSATLATSEPDASARFGASLAMDATTVLVAAPDARCPAGADARTGALYRYEQLDGVWALAQRICDDTVHTLGGAVALNERSAIASSRGEFGVRLHEFDRLAPVWQEIAARDDASPGAWGSPLAVSASMLVVGAPLAEHPVTFTQPGAVDVYDTGLLFDDQFESAGMAQP